MTNNTDFLTLREGSSPLILCFPHSGTQLDAPTRAALNETGLALADTDWHVDRLYADLFPEATIIATAMHRYVVDVNRDPAGTSLYPGQNTTGLCPLTDFDNRPIYQDGADPDTDEIERRRLAFHAPYHAMISAQIARLRRQHPHILLYDCHSIREQVPYLFDGILPDLNLGTFEQRSCHPDLATLAEKHCQSAEGYSAVHNGRFKGGWTTRHYGQPDRGVHAIQMELAQSTYLTQSQPPWTYSDAKAAQLRDVLRPLLITLVNQLSQLPGAPQ